MMIDENVYNNTDGALDLTYLDGDGNESRRRNWVNVRSGCATTPFDIRIIDGMRPIYKITRKKECSRRTTNENLMTTKDKLHTILMMDEPT